MTQRLRITWSNGLNSDVPAYELPDGFFNSGKNVRILNGIATGIPGTGAAHDTYTHSPYWLGLFNNTTSAQGFWLLSAGDSKVYASIIGTTYEITRYADGPAITSMTAVGDVVTITTATNHGLSNLDFISVWGCSPSTYNTNSAPVSVTSPTEFTYTADTAPAISPATVVGLYAENVTSNFTTSGLYNRQVWTGANMGGVFYINHDEEGLYYWAGDTSLRLRKTPGAYVARATRSFKNYVIQLAPTMDGTAYPYRILWSTSAEPGTIPTSFDASDTNDAGFVDRTEGGECVDCLPLGDVNIIYKEEGRFAMELLPGSDSVFRFTQLPGTEGLLHANCVVDTPVGHVFLSSNYQVLLHTGGACTNLSQGRVNNLINRSGRQTYFLAKNSAKNEVWIFIANVTDDYPDRALVWNWKDDKWGIREYGTQNVPFAIETFWAQPGVATHYLMAVNTSGSLVREDLEGSSVFGTSFEVQIARTGIDCGDPDLIKNLQRSRWNYDMADASTATIEHGSAMTADKTPTYATGATYTVGTTNYVNARATGGRYLAVRATWTADGGVRSTDIEYTEGGRR